MKYIVTINNKSYEVEVEKGQANIISTTEVAAPSIPVVTPQPAAPAAVPQPAAVAPATAANGEAVKAPMPGTILNIKVDAGTKVKKGDTIVILEAMKMENEIVAPVDGVVVQIMAVKGSSVSTGDILAVIQ